MSGANEVSASVAAIEEQPMPVPNDRPALWDLVIADSEGLKGNLGLGLRADMRARDLSGREKYHVPLQAFNGRDALTDAYQEVLDGIVYTKQAMEEGPRPRAVPLTTIYEELLKVAIEFKILLMTREAKP